jgi:hypothetical protein
MASNNDFDLLVEGSGFITEPETGRVIATLVKGAIDMETCAKVWPVIAKINLKTDNRGKSSGLDYTNESRKGDRQVKSRRTTETVNSGVIGFYDRYPRIPFCRQCAWNQQNNADWQKLLPLFAKVNDVHKKYAIKEWAAQMRATQTVKPDWLIPNTIYSTVTVNKNYRTGYHFDGKNMAGGFSSMLLLRQGHITGGYTVFPRYRVAIKMDTGDIALFNGQGELHGNTEISVLTKGAQRCTMVHYFRKGMLDCLSAKEELERAKRYQGGSLK